MVPFIAELFSSLHWRQARSGIKWSLRLWWLYAGWPAVIIVAFSAFLAVVVSYAFRLSPDLYVIIETCLGLWWPLMLTMALVDLTIMIVLGRTSWRQELSVYTGWVFLVAIVALLSRHAADVGIQLIGGFLDGFLVPLIMTASTTLIFTCMLVSLIALYRREHGWQARHGDFDEAVDAGHDRYERFRERVRDRRRGD